MLELSIFRLVTLILHLIPIIFYSYRLRQSIHCQPALQQNENNHNSTLQPCTMAPPIPIDSPNSSPDSTWASAHPLSRKDQRKVNQPPKQKRKSAPPGTTATPSSSIGKATRSISAGKPMPQYDGVCETETETRPQRLSPRAPPPGRQSTSTIMLKLVASQPAAEKNKPERIEWQDPVEDDNVKDDASRATDEASNADDAGENEVIEDQEATDFDDGADQQSTSSTPVTVKPGTDEHDDEPSEDDSQDDEMPERNTVAESDSGADQETADAAEDQQTEHGSDFEAPESDTSTEYSSVAAGSVSGDDQEALEAVSTGRTKTTITGPKTNHGLKSPPPTTPSSARADQKSKPSKSLSPKSGKSKEDSTASEKVHFTTIERNQALLMAGETVRHRQKKLDPPEPPIIDSPKYDNKVAPPTPAPQGLEKLSHMIGGEFDQDDPAKMEKLYREYIFHQALQSANPDMYMHVRGLHRSFSPLDDCSKYNGPEERRGECIEVGGPKDDDYEPEVKMPRLDDPDKDYMEAIPTIIYLPFYKRWFFFWGAFTDSETLKTHLGYTEENWSTAPKIEYFEARVEDWQLSPYHTIHRTNEKKWGDDKVDGRNLLPKVVDGVAWRCDSLKDVMRLELAEGECYELVEVEIHFGNGGVGRREVGSMFVTKPPANEEEEQAQAAVDEIRKEHWEITQEQREEWELTEESKHYWKFYGDQVRESMKGRREKSEHPVLDEVTW